MSQTMTTADVLRKARARVEDPAKWHKGYYRDDSNLDDDRCGVCAEGATEWAVTGKPTTCTPEGADARRVLRDALVDMGRRGMIVAFNDDPATTHADVLAAFDRAIELAEGRA